MPKIAGTGSPIPDAVLRRLPDDRTDLEWELRNLEAAREDGGKMWSAIIRAMYRDTCDVPAQYDMVIRNLRTVLADIDAMVNERKTGGEA